MLHCIVQNWSCDSINWFGGCYSVWRVRKASVYVNDWILSPEDVICYLRWPKAVLVNHAVTENVVFLSSWGSLLFFCFFLQVNLTCTLYKLISGHFNVTKIRTRIRLSSPRPRYYIFLYFRIYICMKICYY